MYLPYVLIIMAMAALCFMRHAVLLWRKGGRDYREASVSLVLQAVLSLIGAGWTISHILDAST